MKAMLRELFCDACRGNSPLFCIEKDLDYFDVYLVSADDFLDVAGFIRHQIV